MFFNKLKMKILILFQRTVWHDNRSLKLVFDRVISLKVTDMCDRFSMFSYSDDGMIQRMKITMNQRNPEKGS